MPRCFNKYYHHNAGIFILVIHVLYNGIYNYIKCCTERIWRKINGRDKDGFKTDNEAKDK